MTHEVIGGPLDDYVVNEFFDIPLIGQMGASANRLYSGKGDDSYSVILNEQKDVIFDQGGDWKYGGHYASWRVSFRDVFLAHEDESFVVYRRAKNLQIERLLDYTFYNLLDLKKAYQIDHKVQFHFKESISKEIVSQMFNFPNSPNDELDWSMCPFSWSLLLKISQ